MNFLLLTLLLSVGMDVQPSTRNLLLFGKDKTEHKQQLSLLKQDSIGMAERDLVIITVEKEAEYKKYNVAPNQFTLLLIGKDGGEKLRSTKPVEVETIFRLIDSMPMRQAEMSNKKN
jgi:hypothetical protein